MKKRGNNDGKEKRGETILYGRGKRRKKIDEKEKSGKKLIEEGIEEKMTEGRREGKLIEVRRKGKMMEG